MKKSYRRLDTLRLDDRINPSTQYYPQSYFLFDASQFETAPSRSEPVAIARDFLAANAAKLGAGPSDFDNALVTNSYTDADTGFSHVYFRQVVNGLEVAYADMNVNLAADGRVISAGGGFVPNLAQKLGVETRIPVNTPNDAIRWAESILSATGNNPQIGDSGLMEAVSSIKSPLQNQVYQATASITRDVLIASKISEDPINGRLAYVPTSDGSAVLSWELTIRTRDGEHWFNMNLADCTGSVAAVSDWVDDASYSVLALPNESVQDGGFSVVTDPHFLNASPFGWHDTNGVAGPEFTDTRGNNVDAHLDRDANNIPDTTPTRPAGGASLDFSGYPFDPAQAPTVVQNQNVAQVNLFYLNNMLHDIHYQYGFTPAAGNFQTNNYGLGGAGNDAVQADAQDGSGTNNANFGTPADGSAPRMQQYIFTAATPDRDSDLDNGIIIHEYAHGVSNRLTGGPANSNALNATQSGGMGEGWGDFYAMMFSQRTTDGINDAYPMGTYALNQAPTGAGIRRKPYSFNMTIDPLTFDAFGTSGTTSYGVARSTEVHNSGELWASTLWDLNWLLVTKYGFDADLSTGWSASPGPANAGNKLTLRLVMDGMKLQPANPSFIQARDAIIAADNALTGGANLLEIWTAFARRGLGVNAATASSAATTVTVDFTIPAAVQNLAITSTVPAVASTVSTAPTAFTINVSAPIDPATLAASDFQVNGIPATNVAYTVGSTVVQFTFSTTPVLSEGLQTMTAAAGAFNRASDGNPLTLFISSFRYDAVPMQVLSTTPAAGSSTLPPLTTFDLNLNEPVLPSSVSIADLALSNGTVSSFSLLNGNQTIRFTLNGLTAETSLTASVAAGALQDVNGGGNLAFNSTYQLDFATRTFPALTGISPAGARIAKGTITGIVNTAADLDDFTIALDAGQAIALTLTPAGSLRSTVTIIAPDTTTLATQTATAAGQSFTSTPVLAPVSGIYTVRVQSSAGTTGSYTLDLLANAAQEVESVQTQALNNTAATAESLNAGFVTSTTSLGSAKRAAVLGTSDFSSVYSAAAVSYSFEDISGTGTTVLSNSDDTNTSFNIPFAFNFYGTNYSTVFVSDNGLITFGTGSSSNANSSLTSTPSQAAIAVLWDDLETSANGIKWQVLGTPGSRRVVIQWENARYWTSAGTGTFTLQFQAVLFEGTNEIRLNYSNLNANVTASNGGTLATVGIKNSTSTSKLLLSQNATSIYHGNNKSTLISPPVGTRDYYSFTAAAGDNLSVIASALTAGTIGVELYDTNGTSLLATGSTGASNYTAGISNVTAPAAGTYFAAITSANASVNYSLTTFVNAAFETETANNTAATAPALPANAFGNLGAGDTDWFTITVPANSTLAKLETSTPGAVLNLKIDLFAADGTTLIASGVALADGRNEALSASGLTPGGNYKVRLTSQAGTGDYQLSFIAPAAPGEPTTTINAGATQRSRIRSLEVTFDQAVTVDPAAITLTRGATVLSGSVGGGISTSLVGSQTVLTLNFPDVPGVEFSSLSDGNWTLSILANGVSALDDSQPLITDYTRTNIKRLFGDINGDNTVNAGDLADFGNAFGATVAPTDAYAAFDWNADGTINAADFAEFGNRFGISL